MTSPMQMPGPMEGSYESGFDATGEDMNWLAPTGEFPIGVQLPGDPAAEQGWLFGEDMAGMASEDQIPQGMDMGIESGMDMATDEFASSAEHTIVRTFEEMYGPQPGMQEEHGTLPGMAMRDLPVGSIPNQGYPNGSADHIRGIDSMRGLDLAGGHAPLGEQDTNSTGPVGDRWESLHEAEGGTDGH